jgi:hypothetical protein
MDTTGSGCSSLVAPTELIETKSQGRILVLSVAEGSKEQGDQELSAQLLTDNTVLDPDSGVRLQALIMFNISWGQ